MSEYVPTTEEMLDGYVTMRGREIPGDRVLASIQALSEAERWLAEHDAEKRTEWEADLQRTIDDLGEDLRIARESRDAAIEAMNQHRCGEQTEAAYRRALRAEMGTEEPESTDTFEHGYQAAIADMRWLADGRDRYTDERVQFQVRSVQQVARVLDGDELAAEGWLPSWLWDEWAAKRRYPALPVEQGKTTKTEENAR